MSDQKVWFGTEDYMTWVPAPLVGGTRGRQRSRETGTLLNGNGYSIQTPMGAQHLSLSWNPRNMEQGADLLQSFFDGTYGSGPYYYWDPMTTWNVLPPFMAAPFHNISGYGSVPNPQPMAPGLRGTDAQWFYGVDTITTVAPAGNLPIKVANYGATAARTEPIWRFPVPPGYRFFLAIGGTSTGGVVKLNGNNVALSAPNTFVPQNNTNNYVNGQAWANVQLNTNGGGISIRWMLSTLMPISTGSVIPSPERGWIPGRGHGPLMLESDPSITDYMAVLGGRQGISANFIEVNP